MTKKLSLVIDSLEKRIDKFLHFLFLILCNYSVKNFYSQHYNFFIKQVYLSQFITVIHFTFTFTFTSCQVTCIDKKRIMHGKEMVPGIFCQSYRIMNSVLRWE